jgi:uncharacterized membrane protein YqgA involved in biofilm formation
VGGIGALVAAKLPEAIRHTAMQAIAIVTLLVGISNLSEYATASTQAMPRLTLVKVQ